MSAYIFAEKLKGWLASVFNLSKPCRDGVESFSLFLIKKKKRQWICYRCLYKK